MNLIHCDYNKIALFLNLLCCYILDENYGHSYLILPTENLEFYHEVLDHILQEAIHLVFPK